MRALNALLAVLFSSLLIYGCGDADHQDVKKWMSESSRDLRGRVPPLPELKPFPVVSYEAAGKLDPFSAERVEPDKKDGGGGKVPDFNRPREQLENYPIEAIRFIGLVSKVKTKSRHALVQVEGVIHQVKVGNYLGQNYGRITEIGDNQIVLIETVQDTSGETNDWVERQMTLQLYEGAPGKEASK